MQTLQCEILCEEGTYGDTNLGTCQYCHPTCETCSGGSKSACLSCSNGFLLLGTSCI
jgi:proprotein convertase subtilisin/kexin type 5